MRQSVSIRPGPGYGRSPSTSVGWGIALLGLATAVLSAAPPARPAVAAKSVTVRIRDAGIALSPRSLPAGTVTFLVKDIGKFNHNFGIAGKKTQVLKPGKSARLTVRFKKPGKYAYASTLPGDAHRGLKGIFRVTAAPKPAVNGNVVLGKVVFKSTCTVCHTLKAAGAVGTIGPNFDQLRLPYQTIVNTVANGKSGSMGTMPSYKSSLTSAQIENVAAFIYASEHP